MEKAGNWGLFCTVDGGGGGNEGEYYHSGMLFYIQKSGFVPRKLDSSVGQAPAGDGGDMTIAVQGFARGLGVPSASVVGVALQGQCRESKAYIGVYDETQGPLAIPVGPFGGAQFEVLVDGVSQYKIPVMNGGDAAVRVAGVDLTSAQELLLIVSDGGDDFTRDHVDWADAIVVCCTARGMWCTTAAC